MFACAPTAAQGNALQADGFISMTRGGYVIAPTGNAAVTPVRTRARWVAMSANHALRAWDEVLISMSMPRPSNPWPVELRNVAIATVRATSVFR